MSRRQGFVSLAVLAAARGDKQAIQVPGWPGDFPLSWGIVSDGVVLASGMPGVDFSTMHLVPGGVQAETKQALSNSEQVLKAGGSSMAEALGCAVYLKDLGDFAAMNEVYLSFFPKPRPVRVAMQVGSLVGGASVEIKCTASAGGGRQEVKVPGWPDLSDKLPFSVGIVSGDYVYAAGMSGLDFTTGKMVEGGVQAETHQALQNVQKIVEAGGSSMANVVDCAVYLQDLKDFATMTAAYSEHFRSLPPSRVAMQVGALAGGAAVEIQCFAALPAAGRKAVSVPSWPAGPPFLSAAIVSGGFLFASGMQGLNFTTGKLVPGGIAAETAQTLTLVKQVVEAGGSSMANVVDCAVYVGDVQDFAAMNEVYATFFPKPPPARVSTMPGGLAGSPAVEVQCTAALSANSGVDEIVV